MVERTLKARINATVGSFSLAVELSVPNGLIVLFGPSGSGKSTLLDCIAGLRVPDSGEILLGDQVFYDSDRKVHLPPQKRRIGYVFQRPTLFPHLTVGDNIGFGLQSWSPARRKARLDELLDLMQLRDLADRYPANLSGGEGQRAAVARALAPEPQLLLLDEPFSALESQLRKSLGEKLRSLQRKLSLPMVLVTHSRAAARELADLVVYMQAGRIQTTSTPDQLIPD
jgi:molybdate transport system ATP-binding protein